MGIITATPTPLHRRPHPRAIRIALLIPLTVTVTDTGHAGAFPTAPASCQSPLAHIVPTKEARVLRELLCTPSLDRFAVSSSQPSLFLCCSSAARIRSPSTTPTAILQRHRAAGLP